jgi:hypothetical protein
VEGADSTHGEMKNATQFSLENLKRRDHSEDTGTDERIILKWFFWK